MKEYWIFFGLFLALGSTIAIPGMPAQVIGSAAVVIVFLAGLLVGRNL